MTIQKLPFDGICLRRILAEVRAMGPLTFGDLRAISARTLLLTLRSGGRPIRWIVDLRPEFLRFHRTQVRMPSSLNAPFARTVQARLRNAPLIEAAQVGLDRIATLDFESSEGPFALILELTGRHANAVLVHQSGKIEAALTQVHGEREVRAGAEYAYPPNTRWEIQENDAPPTVRALGVTIEEALRTADDPNGPGWWLPGVGAYPLTLSDAQALPSYSEALDRHFGERVASAELDQARRRLESALRRVADARRRALEQVRGARAQAESARRWQEQAELILAHASMLPVGADPLETLDYEGLPVVIALDPERTPIENADRLFDKAKRAKAAFAGLGDQERRLGEDLYDVQALLVRVQAAPSVPEIEALRAEADRRRWLHRTKAEVERDPKSDLPPAARRIRELLGPGGVKVLYGETAEANDYLTQHVARPWDWWLHVRGSASAHVVIPTGKKPERIGPEVLRFAAEVAVRHSAAKHASYVPVDYTLRKYVRKPRGSAKGAVVYTHEKTLHIKEA